MAPMLRLASGMPGHTDGAHMPQGQQGVRMLRGPSLSTGVLHIFMKIIKGDSLLMLQGTHVPTALAATSAKCDQIMYPVIPTEALSTHLVMQATRNRTHKAHAQTCRRMQLRGQRESHGGDFL